MMTVAPVASASDAAGYYSSKDNYYFLDDLESQWLGEGARELGLEGPVDLDTFTNVLHGRLPDGTELGKDVQGSHVHRPGHDFTFSAPKSISLLILAGGDKRLLEAHHEAVKETLSVIEQMVTARDTKDGVTSIVPTGKMVAALFTHDTSRNLDPMIHTHAVLANVTELEGKWKALATDYIHGAGFIETMYRHQVSFGKIYRNSLKSKTEALGYETELTGGRHELWEIKGFTEEVLDEFSSRHREIIGQVGEEASLKSRDVAALDTRQRKQDISRLRDSDEPVVSSPEKTVSAPSGSPRLPESREPREPVPASPALPETEHRQTDASHNEKTPENGEPGGALQEQLPGSPAVPEQEQPIVKPETTDGRSRLQARWQRQMEGTGFDIDGVMQAARAREATRIISGDESPSPADIIDTVREAISVLSDSRTRFTYGDLLMTAHHAGSEQHTIPALRRAIDQAISENLLVPLDGDKGVFTSGIHLLDELSVQALAADIVKENRVIRFRSPADAAPAHLKSAEHEPIAILNAPASVQRLRETTEELVTMSRKAGREVRVLASSVERAMSLEKSKILKGNILQRSRVLDSTFSLSPQSTLIIEGAEKLGLKEMLVLTGEAREKNAQLLFLDSAGRQSNANALSVLSTSGVPRHGLTEPSAGLEARVISITDKRDRYHALAERFAELSSPDNPVTAAVVGAREQQQLTGIIRDALQNAGKLDREGVVIEARTPVFITAKERKLASSYRPGMVLEDRSEKNETRHYIVDRVHDDTRMLSLIDSDGVLSRVKLSALNGDWRAFTQEKLSVAPGERLFAVAGDKQAGLRARDRLTVTAVENGELTLTREGQKHPLTVRADRPLYVTHGYVSAPGARDNEQGTVLASLNGRDLSSNMMNALAQSGSQAEIFTGEALHRAEDKLARMRTGRSPLALVQQASGKDDAGEALNTLNAALLTDTQKAVTRSIAQMRDVSFSEAKLLDIAGGFISNVGALRLEVARQVKEGDLIPVRVKGEPRFVARATWEMEKEIVAAITDGKNTQTPLMANIAPALLDGLTQGQKVATSLILQSTDRFTAVQGYAGTGKTTQFRAVQAAIDTLPEGDRPVIIGLAPTHRAVKEMRDNGIEAQTLKSFVTDWQQRTAAGETVRYDRTLFLIDESSMIGNQDTAAAYRAITAGDGRAVPVGDVAQLESPESGAPFQLMQERSPIDVAVMKEIVRQRDANLKSAVYSVIENKAGAALEKISSVSPLTVPRRPGTVAPAKSVAETKDPVSFIVADYMSRTDAAREQTMILVQLNADRRAVNSGIHRAMVESRELGQKAVIIPVLERITGGRHDFNRIQDWKPGQVVQANDRYLSVTGIDKGGDRVLLRDEAGRIHYYSPQELNATEIEVFDRREIELREGDQVRMTKTQKLAGHAAHEQYRVEQLRDNGEIVLKNRDGSKTIDPLTVTADRHVDYAWAVTGYGGQGASANYDIVLEGTEGARKRMSGMRAFYINASRARDHVQVVTDGVNDWMDTLKERDKGPVTAHDAIHPEPERAQARQIWAMGQPLARTAIGRTFLREQGLGNSAVPARVIPPTRKFPDAHLALPVYDGNGKTAGLAMLPLQPETGRIRAGEVRHMMTPGGQAAVLQKSRSGETVIVSDMAQALDAARANPDAGVLLLTGARTPSAQLLKVAGGLPDKSRRPDATLLHLVQTELQAFLRILPPDVPEQENKSALIAAREVANKLGTESPVTLPDSSDKERSVLSDRMAARIAEAMKEKVPSLPGENVPDYTALVRLASHALAKNAGLPDDAVLHSVVSALSANPLPAGVRLPAEIPAGSDVPVSVLRQIQEEQRAERLSSKAQQQDLSEQGLASAARALERQGVPRLPEASRGREPERDMPLPDRVRDIQKER
ncbi:IncF plasmid conjugative transfer DNA-nicking and unwinding protein TraI (plasmid) [Paramixta manurensis]|uniref:IncF plasmid conjugative transfer DNA-nicking and unwinding protein TraI n=1 Tax=Paramixta manurensis TaxID=2740817 RepID=A0A6M8UI42_9GAMM|nr:IncF plasmid conjugative transfer DNA-nicking and unwinding protein TraI [Erwiniaceae bacterium PD-1]